MNPPPVPTGPGGAPTATPSTLPTPESVAVASFRLELTKLKNDLDIKGTGTSLMKFAENRGTDFSDWKNKPAEAITFFEEYERQLLSTPVSGPKSDVDLAAKHQTSIRGLIDALRTPTGTGEEAQRFAVALETAINIAENINRRKETIKDAKTALGDLNENALNGKVKHTVENIYHTYERMSMPEKAATIGVIFMFFKMALKDDKGNTLFGPLLKWGTGILGVNLLAQAATGKSGVDWAAEKLGLERFLPTSADQLPDFMKALAQKTSIDKGVPITMPSELVAMGKLGPAKMSELLQNYDPAGESIDPEIFGLKPAKDGDTASGEITPKHLWMLVDTMVRKNKTITDAGGTVRGDKQAFFLEYCTSGRHDFTFMEAISDLFQAESMKILSDSMSTEEWEKYKKVIEQDNDALWKGASNVMLNRGIGPIVRRYGVQIYGLTYLTTQRKSSDGNAYTYQFGDDMRVNVKVGDSVNSRKQSANHLMKLTKKYMEDQINKFGAGTGLVANPASLIWTGSKWEINARIIDSAGGTSDEYIDLTEYGNDGGHFMLSRGSVSVPLDANFSKTGLKILDK